MEIRLRLANEVEIESFNMANVLMLLSRNQTDQRVFECKTCNRQFSSFQALGGHRASHKKPKLISSSNDFRNNQSALSNNNKPKVHECSICGSEFAIGQALGGHMRRHRATINEGFVEKKSINERKRPLLLDLNLPPLDNEVDYIKFGVGIGMELPMVDCLH